jgi:C4-dicarboxylate-specific signal transduction histidine kinase
MAMTLAHELNQPLTAAANFLAAARRFGEASGLSDDVRSALSSSETQIQRAGQIIRRIRNMVAAGGAKREPVDVRDAVNLSRALLESSGGTGDIALDIQIAPGAGQVLADQVQLEQILLNLLRNAEEASDDARAAKVQVSADLLDGMVRISVRDRGVGIEPHRIDTLFDALQPSSSGGLGVGLSLCRTMVEAHGGRIWAAAAEGGGTTISFTLPALGQN